MKKASLLGFLLFLASGGVATAVVIDDFEAGYFWVGYDQGWPPYTVTDTQYDPTGLHIIGGQRDVTFVKTTGDDMQPNVFCPAEDNCWYTSFFDSNAIWTTTYGLAADLNADLTADGADAILVDLVLADMHYGPNPTPLQITVVSGSGTASSTQDLLEPRMYVFLFTDFPGVDFTDVDRLIFEVTQDSEINDAIDFAIAAFGTGTGGQIGTEGRTCGGVKALYR